MGRKCQASTAGIPARAGLLRLAVAQPQIVAFGVFLGLQNWMGCGGGVGRGAGWVVGWEVGGGGSVTCIASPSPLALLTFW